jgi:hypothetical protein
VAQFFFSFSFFLRFTSFSFALPRCVSRATQQWFANLEGIKDQALRVLDDVKFFPASCAFSPVPCILAHASTGLPMMAQPDNA